MSLVSYNPFSPLPDNVDIVSKQADSLASSIGSVINRTSEGVGSAVGGLGAAVKGVGSVVGGLGSAVKGVGNAVGDIGSSFNGIGNVVGNVVGGVVGGVGDVVGGVGSTVDQVGGAVQNLGNSLALEKTLKSWMRDEIEMRSVKILDIGYIAVLYFIIGVTITMLFDKLFGEWTIDADANKSTIRIGLELIGMIWLFGVTTYLVRIIVERIPSPMSYIPLSNPDRKFEHGRVRELSSATVFTLILMGTSYHFRLKLEYFYKRITGRVSNNAPVLFM